jgi:prevent-host-death family protein
LPDVPGIQTVVDANSPDPRGVTLHALRRIKSEVRRRDPIISGLVFSEERRIMAEKSSDLPVRIIGSRELHQNLPTILRELERNDVRYVLTVHGKPRAVLVGAEPYMNLVLDRKSPSEALVGLQLSALLGETLNPDSLEDLEKVLGQKSD